MNTINSITAEHIINACKNNDLDKLRKIHQQGIDIWTPIKSSQDILQYCLNSDYIDIIKYLITNTNDEDFINHVKSNLPDSARNGAFKVVHYLIELGADVHQNNNWAVIYAVENSYFNIVKLLVQHGAQIDSLDNLALHYSSREGTIEIFNFLLEHKANLYDRDHSALKTACEYEQHQMILLIFSLYEDKNLAKQLINSHADESTKTWFEKYITMEKLYGKLNNVLSDNAIIEKKNKI